MKKGFTLVELLVVISIIGLLMGLSIFSIQNSKKSARDAKRKSDIETIRSGLELYRSDCNAYPENLEFGGTLVGDGNTAYCPSDNVYIKEIPNDPQSGERSYDYKIDGLGYELCASLENVSDTQDDPDICDEECGEKCNYSTTNP